MDKFTCCECNKQKSRNSQVFEGKENNLWCRSCYNKEMKRSSKEDCAPNTGTVSFGPLQVPSNYFRSRPPKCALDKSDYKRFGY